MLHTDRQQCRWWWLPVLSLGSSGRVIGRTERGLKGWSISTNLNVVVGKCIPNRGLTLVIAIRWLQACFVCLINLSKMRRCSNHNPTLLIVSQLLNPNFGEYLMNLICILLRIILLISDLDSGIIRFSAAPHNPHFSGSGCDCNVTMHWFVVGD